MSDPLSPTPLSEGAMSNDVSKDEAAAIRAEGRRILEEIRSEPGSRLRIGTFMIRNADVLLADPTDGEL